MMSGATLPPTDRPPTTPESLPPSDGSSDAMEGDHANDVDVNDNVISLSSAQDSGIALRQSINRRPVAHMERFRHKRQTLQDMARPLKHWLYHHRNNPYPTKSDKLRLAANSNMTLTQVSNWFANARRRLKNTVRQPELSWEKRIQMYNSCIEGNQERLSVSSDDSCDELMMENDSDIQTVMEDEREAIHTSDDTVIHLSTDDDCLRYPDRDTSQNISPCSQQNMQKSSHTRVTQEADCVPSETNKLDKVYQVHEDFSVKQIKISPCTNDGLPVEDGRQAFERTPPRDEESHGDDTTPHKYKHTMLQRYLNDTCEVLQLPPTSSSRHRNLSGSLSSHDFEEISSSKGSPMRDTLSEDDYAEFSRNWPSIESRAGGDLYWKEISAALALTTLSRAASLKANNHP